LAPPGKDKKEEIAVHRMIRVMRRYFLRFCRKRQGVQGISSKITYSSTG
jgi:hypothetical protein